MKRFHYISGLTIALFIGLHLINHLYSVFGAEKHIELMNTMRYLYRNIIFESILLIAVLIQIVSGIQLFFVKRKIASTFYDKLQIWTGLYLAIFFIIHLSAVISGRYLLQLDTNFYFGVAGLNTSPFNLFFIPYYGLAVISFFGHMVAIHNLKIKQNILGLSPKVQSNVLLIFGFFLTFVIFYGLTNHFNGVAIPAEYNILIGK